MNIISMKIMNLLLFFLLILTSCSPIYQTRYTLTPPESSEGKACVFQCDNINLQCHQVKDENAEQCEQRSNINYNFCQSLNLHRDKDDQESCFHANCAVDYSYCDSQYRNCYQTCGGKVSGTTVCTAFCGK